MSIETTVYSALINAAGVTEYTDSRIYAFVAPEGTGYPLAVYNITSESPVSIIGTQRESGLKNKTVQVDCWAKSAVDMDGLANAVTAAMHAMTGARALRLSQNSVFDSQTMLFKCSIDFSVWAAG